MTRHVHNNWINDWQIMCIKDWVILDNNVDEYVVHEYTSPWLINVD